MKEKYNFNEKENIYFIKSSFINYEMDSNKYSNSDNIIRKNRIDKLPKLFDKNNENENYFSDNDYKEKNYKKKRKNFEKLNLSTLKIEKEKKVNLKLLKNKKVEGNILIDGSSTSIKDDKQNNYSTHSNIGENIINNSNVNNINNNNNNNKLIINDNKDKIINQNKLNKIKKKELLFKKNDLINKSSSYENNSKELIINNIKLNRNSINNDNILHNRANLLKEEESSRPIINVSEKSEHNGDIQEININNSINLDILNHKKYLIKDTEFIIIEKKQFNMIIYHFFMNIFEKEKYV